MLLQSRPLEVQIADNLRGKDETDLNSQPSTLAADAQHGREERERNLSVTGPVRADNQERLVGSLMNFGVFPKTETVFWSLTCQYLCWINVNGP